MKRLIILPGFLTMIFTLTANAGGGVPIEPGLWEMNSTMTMSMMPKPQVHTSKECITETELNPEDFNQDEENPCDISNVSIDGNSASWSIACPTGNGAAMEGQWKFISNGDQISGNGSMSANIAGQEMSFTMTWEGKRVGDCE